MTTPHAITTDIRQPMLAICLFHLSIKSDIMLLVQERQSFRVDAMSASVCAVSVLERSAAAIASTLVESVVRVALHQLSSLYQLQRPADNDPMGLSFCHQSDPMVSTLTRRRRRRVCRRRRGWWRRSVGGDHELHLI